MQNVLIYTRLIDSKANVQGAKLDWKKKTVSIAMTLKIDCCALWWLNFCLNVVAVNSRFVNVGLFKGLHRNVHLILVLLLNHLTKNKLPLFVKVFPSFMNNFTLHRFCQKSYMTIIATIKLYEITIRNYLVIGRLWRCNAANRTPFRGSITA